MSDSEKQELISDLLDQVERREQDFPTIDRHGRIFIPEPSKSGIVTRGIMTDSLKGYSGLALEVNDHGNVTVWQCRKNGNRREIASRV